MSVEGAVKSVGWSLGSPIGRTLMARPQRDLRGVSGGADPLVVHVPGFATKLIGQSNPLTSASNNITLTLSPDCDVSAGSYVTVSGLVQSQTPSGQVTVHVSESWGFSSSGSWERGSGTLVLDVSESGLK